MRFWFSKRRRGGIQVTRKPSVKSRVKEIRARGPTSIERILYASLDELKVKYIPQYVIGDCIADAYLPDHKLVLEADGTHWHSSREAKVHDARRDAWLHGQGYRVIRFQEVAIWKPDFTNILRLQLKKARAL